MAHLKKENGHLALDGGSGKLVNDCDCCISPSPDCTDCGADCDGPGSITITVSGFTGACSVLNVTVVLTKGGTCEWFGDDGTIFIVLACSLFLSLQWGIVVEEGGQPRGAECSSCSLLCVSGSDHPIGSGDLFGGAGDCSAQTGSFTLT